MNFIDLSSDGASASSTMTMNRNYTTNNNVNNNNFRFGMNSTPALCALSGQLLTDPVKNRNCSHRFNREPLKNYMRRHKQCPICRMHLSIPTLNVKSNNNNNNNGGGSNSNAFQNASTVFPATGFPAFRGTGGNVNTNPFPRATIGFDNSNNKNSNNRNRNGASVTGKKRKDPPSNVISLLDDDDDNNNIVIKKKMKVRHKKPPFVRQHSGIRPDIRSEYEYKVDGAFGTGYYLKTTQKETPQIRTLGFVQREAANIIRRPLPNMTGFQDLTRNEKKTPSLAFQRANLIRRPLPNMVDLQSLPSNNNNNNNNNNNIVIRKKAPDVVDLLSDDDDDDNNNNNNNNNRNETRQIPWFDLASNKSNNINNNNNIVDLAGFGEGNSNSNNNVDWITNFVNTSNGGSMPYNSNGNNVNFRQDGLSQVLSVFPNVKVDWLKKKLQEYRNPDTLISYMAENDYPEESVNKNNSAVNKRDYRDIDKTRDTTSSYRKDARLKLAMTFRKITYSTIDSYFKRYHFQYVPTLEAMLKAQNKNTGHINGASLLKNKRQDAAYQLEINMDGELRKEIQWLEIQNRRKLSEIDILLQKHEYKIKKPNVECGCCYDDVIEEATVQCSAGHKFCAKCLNRYVQEEVFGKQRAKIKCMDMSGQCKGEFNNSTLRRALPPIVLEKYDFTIAQHVLKEAKVDDLHSCPFCDAIAILPVGNNIFSCPNPSCKIESCRMCRKKSHIPFKCDEVDGKSAEEIRRKIEEKMTEAKVRSCPKCSTRFYKEEGCNKMTCPKCGTFSCYLCRKLITKKIKYAHFCQKPHCTHKKCNGCPLYSKTTEDDARAVKEAGLSAKEAALLELQSNGGNFSNAEEVVNKIARELQ